LNLVCGVPFREVDPQYHHLSSFPRLQDPRQPSHLDQNGELVRSTSDSPCTVSAHSPRTGYSPAHTLSSASRFGENVTALTEPWTVPARFLAGVVGHVLLQN
jgi:hypothetical protein